MTSIVFFLGLFVTVMTLTASILVGLQEAADPTHSRIEDLTELEKKIVGRHDQ
jgi:hypothetical protein